MAEGRRWGGCCEETACTAYGNLDETGHTVI